MIFICLGTQVFQFNRLLIKLDDLIQKDEIREDVFAQIGHSDYHPKTYKFKKFLNEKEFQNKIEESSLVIAHGGTGAIVKALKARKPVIAVPRRLKYKEHLDDHQLQIVNFFAVNNYIMRVDDVEDLMLTINQIKNNDIDVKFLKRGNIVDIIENYFVEEG